MTEQIPPKHLSKALAAAAFIVQNVQNFGEGKIFTNEEVRRKFGIPSWVLMLAIRKFVPEKVRKERRRLIRKKRCFVLQGGVIAIRRKLWLHS
ncbi:MAG TPA: hypothetical protein VJJ73_01235 [Candidatus Paceibacterota bacterium]